MGTLLLAVLATAIIAFSSGYVICALFIRSEDMQTSVLIQDTEAAVSRVLRQSNAYPELERVHSGLQTWLYVRGIDTDYSDYEEPEDVEAGHQQKA